MPRIRKRTLKKKSTRNTNHKLTKKIKIKAKTNIGGVKMPIVVEKDNSQITYSTSHSLDQDKNRKNIENLVKRHAKSLKRLADYDAN